MLITMKVPRLKLAGNWNTISHKVRIVAIRRKGDISWKRKKKTVRNRKANNLNREKGWIENSSRKWI